MTEEYGPFWQAMEAQDPIGNETESLLVGLGMNNTKALKVGDQVRLGNGKIVWTVQGVYGHWASVTVRTVRQGIPYWQRKTIRDLSRIVRVES